MEPLDAVLTDTLQAHIKVAEQALAMEDPWEGFAFYLKETCRLQATDRGLNDATGMRFPRATALEDLALVAWANTRILQASRAAGAPDPWRRHLGFLLDGFRAERATPLPQPSLSPRQVYRAMLTLGRRSAGSSDQHPPR